MGIVNSQVSFIKARSIVYLLKMSDSYKTIVIRASVVIYSEIRLQTSVSQELDYPIIISFGVAAWGIILFAVHRKTFYDIALKL